VAQGLLYAERVSVRGNIPYEPSSLRRLSAWLQEKLFERRIVLVTGRLDADLAAGAAAVASHSRQQQDLLWRFHARLAQLTGRPAEEIAEDLGRGLYLDAREALDYGLIDEISTTR